MYGKFYTVSNIFFWVFINKLVANLLQLVQGIKKYRKEIYKDIVANGLANSNI